MPGNLEPKYKVLTYNKIEYHNALNALHYYGFISDEQVAVSREIGDTVYQIAHNGRDVGMVVLFIYEGGYMSWSEKKEDFDAYDIPRLWNIEEFAKGEKKKVKQFNNIEFEV